MQLMPSFLGIFNQIQKFLHRKPVQMDFHVIHHTLADMPFSNTGKQPIAEAIQNVVFNIAKVNIHKPRVVTRPMYSGRGGHFILNLLKITAAEVYDNQLADVFDFKRDGRHE